MHSAQKQILILGGTHFIGRNLVEKLAHKMGFEITLFNRQKTNDSIFPELKKIKGDRETKDIQKINETDWDFIIDLSCYYPQSLIDLIEALGSKPSKYIFISSCSVYDMEALEQEMRSEEAPTLACTETEFSDRSIQSYGQRKAECERIIKANFDHHTILRPALVYGQYDQTDRFYFWPYQVKTQKNIWIPEGGKRKFSMTYVQDLVDTIIKSLDQNSPAGTFNITSHPQTSIGEICHHSAQLLNQKPNYSSLSAEVLLQNDIAQWTGIPLWLNSDFFTFSNEKWIREYDLIPNSIEEAYQKIFDYYDRIDWPEPLTQYDAEMISKLNKIAD